LQLPRKRLAAVAVAAEAEPPEAAADVVLAVADLAAGVAGALAAEDAVATAMDTIGTATTTMEEVFGMAAILGACRLCRIFHFLTADGDGAAEDGVTGIMVAVVAVAAVVAAFVEAAAVVTAVAAVTGNHATILRGGSL
jgi:hypothetical protein